MQVPRVPRKLLPQAVIFGATSAILAALGAAAPFPVLLAERFIPWAGWIEAVLFGLYAAWVGGRLLDRGTAARTRLAVWVLFSCVFFLQLVLGLAGVRKALMTGDLHLPIPALIVAGPVYRGTGLFMPILFASTVLVAGPAWCSHLCYFGAWDGLCASRSARAGRLPGWARWTRVSALALAVAAPLALRLTRTPSRTAEILSVAFALAGIAVMVVLSRKRGVMVHCAAYCPIGLVAGIAGKLSPWRLRVSEGCTFCGRCAAVCRYGALERRHLERRKPGISCTLCGDCLPSCEKDLIRFGLYGRAGKRSDGVRTAFIATVTVLHAVFLAVARI
jgi:ferredoxin